MIIIWLNLLGVLQVSVHPRLPRIAPYPASVYISYIRGFRLHPESLGGEAKKKFMGDEFIRYAIRGIDHTTKVAK